MCLGKCKREEICGGDVFDDFEVVKGLAMFNHQRDAVIIAVIIIIICTHIIGVGGLNPTPRGPR